MIVLDTNVLSEWLRPTPDRRVTAWVQARRGPSLYTTSVTEAELRYGIAILPAGSRRRELSLMADDLLRRVLADRILPFDSVAAAEYARIAAERRRLGKPIGFADCQIAAIASAHAATVATRNLRDFEGAGVKLVNPWRRGGGGGALPAT